MKGIKKHATSIGVFFIVASVVGMSLVLTFANEYHSSAEEVFIPLPVLDTDDYDRRLMALAHVSTTTLALASTTDPFASTTAWTASSTPRLWPVRTVYPQVGALLPFKRILAYYGNFYSKQMGVLGEYPEDELLALLASTTAMWEAADPTTPVVPAIQYIATVAQGKPGREGKYILRMPDTEIDRALALANKVQGILILDVQVGASTLEYELPQLEKYLSMPTVHLGIDPEFSMKRGDAPGTVIGTYDATDINYAAQYLASLVQKYHIPPKVLVVHRFTRPMVTNYKQIQPLPEVQLVMDMDGWGSQAKKKGTYNAVIAPEPVQFTGVKLFYHADLKPPSLGLLTPAEVLSFTPAPIYIQYQ